EQEERQDEQHGAQVDQQAGVGARAEPKENRQDQRLLEDVVVEGAEQLRHEERQEAAFAQQPDLRWLAHDNSPDRFDEARCSALTAATARTPSATGRNSATHRRWSPAGCG